MRQSQLQMRTAGLLMLVMAASVARAEEPKDQPWKRTLRDEVVVELLGVYYQYSSPNTWISPDGKPLAEAPLKGAYILIPPEDETKIMQFALRVKAPSKSDAEYVWTFNPEGTLPINTRKATTERIAPDLLRIAEQFRSDRPECSLRFGVAAGPWKTIFDNGGGQTQEKKPRIIFGKAHNHDGRTNIAVSYTDVDDAVRVVAVDFADKEHVAGVADVEGQNGFWLRELEFNLPSSQVKFYRFQTRPYQWTTFERVSLVIRK